MRCLIWSALAFGAASLNVSCSEPPTETDHETPVTELMGQGEAMVETLCAGCHAIGENDESTHPDAFPLRDLSKRIAIQDLREPFTEGIIVDHPDMPYWTFEPHHVDALLFYLENIQAD